MKKNAEKHCSELWGPKLRANECDPRLCLRHFTLANHTTRRISFVNKAKEIWMRPHRYKQRAKHLYTTIQQPGATHTTTGQPLRPRRLASQNLNTIPEPRKGTTVQQVSWKETCGAVGFTLVEAQSTSAGEKFQKRPIVQVRRNKTGDRATWHPPIAKQKGNS